MGRKAGLAGGGPKLGRGQQQLQPAGAHPAFLGSPGVVSAEELVQVRAAVAGRGAQMPQALCLEGGRLCLPPRPPPYH